MDTSQKGPRLRRSKLIVPSDNWDMISKASRSIADVVHLDIEDGVAPQNRAAARDNIRRARAELDWGNKEVWVRIDHIDIEGTEVNVSAAVEAGVDMIYMAKAQTADDLLRLDALIAREEARIGAKPGAIEIGAVIERVRALHNVEAIASCCPRMGAIVFGIADMSNEFGYRLSGVAADAIETVYIRSRIVLAAKVAGITALDAPFIGFKDVEASDLDAHFSARLGFTGKSAISPKQLEGIHRAFSPTEREIAWALEVREAAKAAVRDGIAIATINGEMVDKPHFVQAEMILGRAGL